jgi:hypothetical protein
MQKTGGTVHSRRQCKNRRAQFTAAAETNDICRRARTEAGCPDEYNK